MYTRAAVLAASDALAGLDAGAAVALPGLHAVTSKAAHTIPAQPATRRAPTCRIRCAIVVSMIFQPLNSQQFNSGSVSHDTNRTATGPPRLERRVSRGD